MWPFPRKTEERGLGAGWIAFEDLITLGKTYSGVSVTQQNAITHPAVYRCVDLNANTIASFPVDCLVKRGESRIAYPEPIWLRSPNDYQDIHGLLAEAVASQDLYDAAFILKVTAPSGQLVGLNVLDPNGVTMRWVNIDGKDVIVYDVTLFYGTTPKRVRLAYNEVLFIKAGLPIPGVLRGVSVVGAQKETIGTGMAARQFGANFFGSGATLSGVIEMPASAQKMTAEEADSLKERFEKKHGGITKSHAVGVLTGGATWKPLSVAPNESQFLELQQYTDVMIANLFGVPPDYVTSTEGVKGYVTGLFLKQMQWYQTGLFPRITRTERAFSSLLAKPAYIKLNVNAWLRMDPEQRVAYYKAGLEGKYLVPNEIRALEDMNPVPWGDEPLASVQWADNTAPPPEPAATEPDDGAAPSGSSSEGGQQ